MRRAKLRTLTRSLHTERIRGGSLRSNDKLLRYDGLTAEDVEELKADYVALENYARRARDLAPSAEHEDQYKVFVLAINELRDANELAYRLAADPSSATQTDFEAYDRHVNRATAYLRRSNEMLGKDYKTTGAAQEISLGRAMQYRRLWGIVPPPRTVRVVRVPACAASPMNA